MVTHRCRHVLHAHIARRGDRSGRDCGGRGSLFGLRRFAPALIALGAILWACRGMPEGPVVGKLGLLAGLTASAIMLYIRFNYLTKKLILNGVT